MELWVSLLGYVLLPVSGVASYFAGRRKKKNDVLQAMQTSINMLVVKNGELVTEVVELRSVNATLIKKQDSLESHIEKLTKENGSLRKIVEDLSAKLENVKTITRTK